MATTARLVDEITGESIQLEYDDNDPQWCIGPVITQSIDYGFAAPRVVQSNIPAANGTQDLTQFHADKTVTWQGWIKPTDDSPFPQLIWDKIRGLCAPNRRPWLYASEEGWNTERRMTLRADSVTSPFDRALGPIIVAGCVWKVPSGVMESADLHQQQILIGGATGGYCITKTGFCITGANGLCLAGGQFGGATNVYNNGTVTTYPFITFTGPAKNPRVINIQSKLGIYLNTTLSPNQLVVIDNRLKNVYEPAQPTPINRLSWYDFTRSSWLTLEQGANPFSYYSDDGLGTCSFSWRDRWT